MKNKPLLRNLLLVLLPGICFYLAWPPRWLFFLGFVGFVPLFILENEVKGRKFGWLTYAALVFFNIITTWWVGYASVGGSIAMILANSGLMLIPFSMYRQARKVFTLTKSLMAFVFIWLSFEYLHFHWEITWPWLTLGNIFAKAHHLVQWYEFIGTTGGSLWVLLINVFLYRVYVEKNKSLLTKTTFGILSPMALSFLILGFYQLFPLKHVAQKKALIIQPNIDPYEKFDNETIEKANDIFGELIRKNIQEKTHLIIFPETALADRIDENNFEHYESIDSVLAWSKKYNASFITGASSYKFHPHATKKPTPTARKYNDNLYYDSYNTALLIEEDGVKDIYHKSKLVPGVERMPYPQIFSFLEYFSIDMGGTTGSLGVEYEAKDFTTNKGYTYAPLICYESIFPDYVSDFVRKGAQILIIITNDGWWDNTDGHKQHLYFAKLRAIENRREILRSANTGISAHINAFGTIKQRTEWWVDDVLSVDYLLYDRQTLFSKVGDYMGRMASFIGIIFILGIFVRKRTLKNNSIF